MFFRRAGRCAQVVEPDHLVGGGGEEGVGRGGDEGDGVDLLGGGVYLYRPGLGGGGRLCEGGRCREAEFGPGIDAAVGGEAGGGEGVVDVPYQQARVGPMAVQARREIVGVVGGEGDGRHRACMLHRQRGDDGGRRGRGRHREAERGRREVQQKRLARRQAGGDEVFVCRRRRPREGFQLPNLCLQAEHRHPPVLRRIAQRGVEERRQDDSRRGPIRTASRRQRPCARAARRRRSAAARACVGPRARCA